MDAFTTGKFKNVIIDYDGLFRRADEMHLDSSQDRIIKCVMIEPAAIKVAVQLPVNPVQDIQIKPGGYARSVIIGSMQNLGGLSGVNANQQITVFSQQRSRLTEKHFCLFRPEVSNRRTREKTEFSSRDVIGKR